MIRSTTLCLMLLSATGATAQSAGFCTASDGLLAIIHEKLTDWGTPDQINRMGLIRIMSRAGIAYAYSKDEGLDPALQDALEILVIARSSDDPLRLPEDQVPAALYDNAVYVAGMMLALCPGVTVPDFTTFAHFTATE